ncbi:immunoglobulin domain-containing family protein [Malacoplasma iowae]|uniref:hypothetical protein n=1 Tax=Malacoplasma iowae TaxID=2116 RepID=UPI002A1897EF|nr:hypothetical protein [Malacoplasma iowae]WPL40056.1 hypothetical protein QX183_00710 [Malacoplasma iowae]
MFTHNLKKILLTGSVTFGIATSAAIPFTTNMTFNNKKNDDSSIKVPGDDSNNEGNDSNNGSNPGDNENNNNNNNNNNNGGQDNNNGQVDEDKDKRIVITKQPTSIEVFQGETSTFSFAYEAYDLSRDDKIFIQWYKNDQLLNNQTSQTLIINSVKQSDVGQYYATISVGTNSSNSQLFTTSNKVNLGVKDESLRYDSIVFGNDTPIASYHNYVENPVLKITVLVQFSKNGLLVYNGERVKVDFYIGDILAETLYASAGFNTLYAMIECDRSDFEGKDIYVVATYHKLVRKETINKWSDW